ncbi:uncharacterized protein SPSK_10948 [Sporothrix schenckii 1099-18]|uniref:Uncharacterized protein n=1 Tax=Sporothrix schenckii 1099-18 TaxID=1397361 RepID=A0A0F2M7A1_SPOSC|nr:uncharacterized protein SPSK_10948 [Sporothrix schenckii 1099-18]KJR85512.1 hypothetical protein SPSK_10948 [Sporothrix schenckii 1099-18]
MKRKAFSDDIVMLVKPELRRRLNRTTQLELLTQKAEPRVKAAPDAVDIVFVFQNTSFPYQREFTDLLCMGVVN